MALLAVIRSAIAWAILLAGIALALYLGSLLAGCVSLPERPTGPVHMTSRPAVVPMRVSAPDEAPASEACAYWNDWAERTLLVVDRRAPSVLVLWDERGVLDARPETPGVPGGGATLGLAMRSPDAPVTRACAVLVRPGLRWDVLESVLEHELGHCLGLPHDETDSNGIMFPYIRPGAEPSAATLSALEEIP